MTKGVSPPKSTAGGGFVFENKVAAYFLSCLLTERAPVDLEFGSIRRIDFQTRADGCLLDDILLTLEAEDGEHRCAISVRSSQQFSGGKAPSDFVASAWKQFLDEGSTQFNKKRDLIVLATVPLPPDLARQLYTLLDWAHGQDGRDLPRHIQQRGVGSKLKRQLFSSFSCPPELAKKFGVSDEKVCDLLRSIGVLEFDFERVPSKDLQTAIGMCQNALQSGSPDEARSLWETLLDIADEMRPSAGYVDLRRLLDRLHYRYQLKVLPSHRADWDRLSAQTKAELATIPDTIGGRVRLRRDNERAKLEQAIAGNSAVVLLGPSGWGKTALLKSWAQQQSTDGKIIWWRAQSFDHPDFASFEEKLGLAHSLCEVLAATPNPVAYLIVDGLDQALNEPAFGNLAVVIQCLEVEKEASPWRLVATCQPEEWERVASELSHANVRVEWKRVVMEHLSEEDSGPVWKTFPALKPLRHHRHLRPLLINPKVLDIIARGLSFAANPDTAKWVGESDLIVWFWENMVERGQGRAKRSVFLQRLGEKQGDELTSETPEGDISDLDPLDALVAERLCVRREGRVAFDHDLYGDWARQRALLSRAAKHSDYLKTRIDSPLWHRAVRLYGLHLLEQNEDIQAWRDAVAELASPEGAATLGQDLLIEAVIFAANPSPILEKLWPDLIANGGVFLRRLLGRFLHVATLPNPTMLAVAKALGEDFDSEAAAYRRLPYWPYWLPMLQFLHSRLTDVVELSRRHVAEIADTWLRSTSKGCPLRKEAAELAVTLAEQMLSFKQGNGIRLVTGDVDKTIYRAAMAAANELPERVRIFALKASGRIEGPAGQSQQDTTANEPQSSKLFFSPSVGIYKKEMQGPWPDGPKRRVDSEFREVFLDTDAGLPLMAAQPSVAGEVLLALLIEEPHPVDLFAHHHLLTEDLGIGHVGWWFPPFYTRGPFLLFLRANPMEALETIIRFVNFATGRWRENRRKQGGEAPLVVIEVNGRRQEWFGDYNVYYWYRNSAPAPDALVCALMALEKWFYDEIDQKHDISDYLQVILARSNSVVFAGLLSAVGRGEPSLLLGVVRPLLAVPEFHYWEMMYGVQSHDYLMIGWGVREGKTARKLAREWHTLPHRQTPLGEQARHLFLNRPEMRPFFEEARRRWAKRLSEGKEDDELKDYLERLIAFYDIENYSVVRHHEYGDVWAFEPPKELRERSEAVQKEIEEKLLLLRFPVYCRQILDAGQPLSEEGLETFWSFVQRASKLTRPPEIRAGVIDVADATCGGAAVLIRLNPEWLKAHPDREKRCIEHILATVRKPPTPGELDSEYSRSNWRWDRFCAEAGPVLWARDPDSRLWRSLVGNLASSFHYETVAYLFASAAKVREKLGDAFGQLQHFVLRWAAVRWQGNRLRTGRKTKADVGPLLRRQLKVFVENKLSPKMPSWQTIASKEASRRTRPQGSRKRRSRQDPGLDLLLIQAAFSWIASLDKAHDEAERTDWITFWREALNCTIRVLGGGIASDQEIEGTRYDWDRWVFERIAKLIVNLRENEEPGTFWKPILGLGPAGHYWVEDLLTEWFLCGLQPELPPPAFVREWRAMVEFAFSCPQWSASSGRLSFYLEDLWCHLLGLGSLIHQAWRASHKSLVARMADLYEAWAKDHLLSPRSAVQFISFLRTPAAKEIIFRGLVWLAEAAEETGRRFWEERYLEDELRSLLDDLWRYCRTGLSREPAAFDAFKRLLRGLAERQNPIALELQSRIGGA